MYRPMLICPLCLAGFTDHAPFAEAVGRMWSDTHKGNIPIPLKYNQCKVCGFVFQAYVFTDEFDRWYYENIYRRTIQDGSAERKARVVAEQSLRAVVLANFLQGKVESSAEKEALDVGCSTGEFMAVLTLMYGWQMVGVEPGSQFTKDLPFTIYPDVKELPKTYEGKFYFISLIHTLEHVSNPGQLLFRLRQLVADEGFLLVEVPDLYMEYSLNTAHPVAFTKKTLALTLKLSGWRIEELIEWKGLRQSRRYPSNILALCRPARRALVQVDGGALVELPRTKPDGLARLRFRFWQWYLKIEEKERRRQHERNMGKQVPSSR